MMEMKAGWRRKPGSDPTPAGEEGRCIPMAHNGSMDGICARGCAGCHLVSCCFHPAFLFLALLPREREKEKAHVTAGKEVRETVAARL